MTASMPDKSAATTRGDRMEIFTDKAIAGLDLEPIKRKLMRRSPGPGWSRKRADGAEIEYRRFLLLMKMFPNELAAPSAEVDRFWHYHILDTQKYARDCHAVFGYFLHHYPYLGLGDEQDEMRRQRAGARMRELYLQTFGSAPPGAERPGSNDGFALAVQDPPPTDTTTSTDTEAEAASDLSYCAAPARYFSSIADCADLYGGRALGGAPAWPAFAQADEPAQVEDVLGQLRFVVTANQRYDRMAEPVM
jgi:hypothetical protein